METPREWAKRYNRQEITEEVDLQNPGAETPAAPRPALEFPTEPFPCPACGQMLAASCRVCVACQQSIDPTEIVKPRARAVLATPARVDEATPGPVPFPWRIFFAVLGICVVLAQICLVVWEEQKAAVVLQAVPIITGVWVFFDALRRGVPRPLRWGVGSMLLLIVVFPWYLARRKLPKSRCPFVEAEVRPLTRFLVLALILLFLFSVIILLVQGPGPH